MTPEAEATGTLRGAGGVEAQEPVKEKEKWCSRRLETRQRGQRPRGRGESMFREAEAAGPRRATSWRCWRGQAEDGRGPRTRRGHWGSGPCSFGGMLGARARAWGRGRGWGRARRSDGLCGGAGEAARVGRPARQGLERVYSANGEAP